ncbi:MAG: hypothetical protein ACRDZ4_08035, partial [Egibacteraceae bacterium]
ASAVRPNFASAVRPNLASAVRPNHASAVRLLADVLNLIVDLGGRVIEDSIERHPHRHAEKRHNEHRDRGGDHAFPGLAGEPTTKLYESVAHALSL